jgi:hypothetical protein
MNPCPDRSLTLASMVVIAWWLLAYTYGPPDAAGDERIYGAKACPPRHVETGRTVEDGAEWIRCRTVDRNEPLYDLVRALDLAAERVESGYCNFYVICVARILGIKELDGKTAANILAHVRKADSPWDKVTDPHAVQKLSNQGRFVVAVTEDHVAVAAPGTAALQRLSDRPNPYIRNETRAEFDRRFPMRGDPRASVPACQIFRCRTDPPTWWVYTGH